MAVKHIFNFVWPTLTHDFTRLVVMINPKVEIKLLYHARIFIVFSCAKTLFFVFLLVVAVKDQSFKF